MKELHPARLVATLLAAAAVFRVIEGRFPRWRERGTDLAYWFFTPVASRLAHGAAVVPGLVFVALFAGSGLDRPSVENLVSSGVMAGRPAWQQLAAVLLLGDFTGYWIHRAFHRGPLWRFHAVHHSSTELDWLAAVRVHPVNDVLARGVQAAPLILLGFSPKVVAVYLPLLVFHAVLLHAAVGWSFGPLKKVVASPAFHRWHHTSQHEGLDKNFGGLLPVWDVVFGTYYMPEGRLPERFGAAGEPVPPGLWGQLLYPFRRI